MIKLTFYSPPPIPPLFPLPTRSTIFLKKNLLSRLIASGRFIYSDMGRLPVAASLKKTDSLFPEIHILNSERPQLLAGLLLLYIQIEGEIKRFHGKNLLTEFISLSQIYKEF